MDPKSQSGQRAKEAQPERADGGEKSTAERARERGPSDESPSDQKAK